MSEVNQVLHGDALDVLRTLEDNSVDSIVTDPPYGMGVVKDIAGLLHAWLNDEDDSEHLGKSGFMGKEWDAGVPGPRYWREALRVLKPGGHILAFSSTRTYDLLVIALRIAGFECRDQIDWIYGSGFPKSLNVSVAIDKMMGKEREVIGKHTGRRAKPILDVRGGKYNDAKNKTIDYSDITAPATPEAAQFSGWGSALKPSHEPICLARKPLAEKSIAAQVLATGTGALNIDASRVGGDAGTGHWTHKRDIGNGTIYHGGGREDLDFGSTNPAGKRFPANTLFSHSVFCVPLGEKRVKGNGSLKPWHKASGIPSNSLSGGKDGSLNSMHGHDYNDEEGCETVQAWRCVEECPVRVLDEQSGVRKSNARPNCKDNLYATNNENVYGEIKTLKKIQMYPDQGGVSRYFQCFPYEDMPPFLYTSKASRRERSEGCEALPERYLATMNGGIGKREHNPDEPNAWTGNNHPTVKPLSLLKYLCAMITPPNGVVLDMFAGSGSTGVACVQSGFRYILIEKEQEYIDIIHSRLAHAHNVMPVQEAAEYECVPECPVRILGEQSGERASGYRKNPSTSSTAWFGTTDGSYIYGERGYKDTGKADRFFKVFPPGSLFEGMDEVSGEQESGQDEELVT